MPGHTAKLGGFFTVIDELYPRQQVIEQIKAFTPQRQQNALPTKYGSNNDRPPIRIYN